MSAGFVLPGAEVHFVDVSPVYARARLAGDDIILTPFAGSASELPAEGSIRLRAWTARARARAVMLVPDGLAAPRVLPVDDAVLREVAVEVVGDRADGIVSVAIPVLAPLPREDTLWPAMVLWLEIRDRLSRNLWIKSRILAWPPRLIDIQGET